jgi:gas vesicle protein
MYQFIIGFGAGTLIGMLFAPKSGEATRGYLGSVAAEGADYVKRHTDDVRGSAMGMVDRGRDAVQRQMEKLALGQNSGVEVYQR